MRTATTWALALAATRLLWAQESEADRLLRAGKAAEARQAYQQLLAAERDPGVQAKLHSRLAQAKLLLGEYAAALADAERAASWYLEQGRPGDAAIARNRAGLARLYAGSYAEAEVAFRQTAELAARAADAEGQAEALSNLANVWFFQGRYMEALAGYEDARRITRGAGGAPWTARRAALLDGNEAALRLRLGNAEGALTIYRKLKETAALAPEEVGQLETNLGVAYRRLGDPFLALEAYQRAQRIFAGHRHRDGELGALKNRGIVQAYDLAELDAAAATFGEALRLAGASGNRREQVHARLYLGEVRLRQNRLAEAAPEFAAAAAGAGEIGAVEEQWKARFGLGRVAARAGRTAEAAARYREAIEIIEGVREKLQLSWRADFLAEKRDVYDALLGLRLAGGAPPGEIFAWMERSRARTLQDRLRGPLESLENLQRRLRPGQLLLSYWTSPRGTAVVWADRARSGCVPLTLPADFAPRLLAALARPGAEWKSAAEAAGQALLPRELPWDTARELLVTPDGELAAVPFAALLRDGAPLVESRTISYLPAAALLLREAAPAARWVWPWQRQIAAFADPAPGSAALPGEAPPAPLPFARQEIADAARIWGGRAALFAGAENRKQQLYAALAQGYPILHLATHGWSDAANPERSRLLFAPPEGAARLDYLFLSEAAALPLNGVRIAILSACETERGKVIRGEGVQSFSRALLAAGAESTVTTLWRTGDRASAALLGAFYEHLRAGEGRAAALASAQRGLWRAGGEHAHPAYWAPFVLTGNGADGVSAPLSWLVVLGVPVALALGVLLLWMGLVRGRSRSGGGLIPHRKTSGKWLT